MARAVPGAISFVRGTEVAAPSGKQPQIGWQRLSRSFSAPCALSREAPLPRAPPFAQVDVPAPVEERGEQQRAERTVGRIVREDLDDPSHLTTGEKCKRAQRSAEQLVTAARAM
jgi:hypothetical protein